MKKVLFLLFILSATIEGMSQTVGISDVTFTPNTQAVLDLSSDRRGFLPPRMELNGNDLPISGAKPAGLMVYNAGGAVGPDGFYYWTGSAWVQITTTSNSIGGSGTLNYVPKFTPNGTTIGNSSIFDDGNVGINTTSPATKLNVRAGSVSSTLTDYTQNISDKHGLVLTSTFSDGTLSPGLFWNTSNDNPTKPKAGIFLQMTNAGSKLAFTTSTTYSTGITNTAMVVDDMGNVGIGVVSPGNRLAVVRVAGTSSDADFRLSDGTQWMFQNSNQSAGAWSPLVQAGDHTLMYSDGSQNTGNLTIGPWSSTAEGIRILASGNVGIGVAAAGAKLHINQDNNNMGLYVTGGGSGVDIARFRRDVGASGIIGITSSGADPQMYFDDESVGGVWAIGTASGTNTFRFAANSSIGTNDKVVIQQDGNMGIGTVTPTELLDVNGKIRMRTGGTAGYVPVSDANGVMTWTNPNTLTSANDGDWTISGSNQYSAVSGNVGIGLTGPGNKLSVQRTAGTSSTADFRLTDGTQWLHVNTNQSNGAWNPMSQAGDHAMIYSDGALNSGAMLIGPWSNTAAGIRILSNGNVGIGITSALFNLDVFSGTSNHARIGNAEVGGWPFNANYAYFGNQTLDHSASGNYAVIQSTAGETILNAASGQSLRFRIANSERMTLSSAGNLGIGSTAAAGKLDIVNAGTGGAGIVAAGEHFNISAFAPNITLTDQSSGVDHFALHLNQSIFTIGRYTGATAVSNDLVINGGNVGIGVSSPGAGLHIGPRNDRHIYLASANNAYGWVMDTRDNGAGSVPFRIFKRTNSSDTEVLTILNQNGNVGIDQTNPTEKLEVNGHLKLSGMVTGTADAIYGNGGRMRDRTNDNGFSVDWTGGTLRFYIENVNVKNFIIDHPDDKDKYLVHTTLEGPENGVYYRGTAKLSEGEAKIDLPEYFNSLTQDGSATVILTPKGKKPYLLSYDDFKANEFTVYGDCQDCEFDWEVKAKRQDVPDLFIEPNKDEIVVSGNGPYKHYGVIRKTGDAATTTEK